MAGFVAFYGGRDLKAGLPAFGTLLWAAPALAQSSDPLPPLLPGQSGVVNSTTSPAPVIIQTQNPPVPLQTAPQPLPTTTIAVPRDWRGGFDAVHSGNRAAARAGIAALPSSVVTPVAKAELYTAKGSPAVDLFSLQTLLAEAPELPQADQLARMAITRGAIASPLIVLEKPIYSLGSAPVRYRAKPVQGE